MYEPDVVRSLFERWGGEEPTGDPGETSSRWAVPHLNHLILDRWLPESGSVLDAGCGRGIETVRMARRGLQVTALDLSASLLEHTRRRVERAGLLDRVSFVRADLTEPLPLPERFSVCVALTGVISHTGSCHRSALQHLVAAAARGGLIILGVDSYYGKIREYLGGGRIDEAEHLAETHYTSTVSETFEDYCFTPAELTGLLAEFGCCTRALYAAPGVGAYGYVGASDDLMRRALALEERCLGVPEMAAAGEQLIAVCEKGA